MVQRVQARGRRPLREQVLQRFPAAGGARRSSSSRLRSQKNPDAATIHVSRVQLVQFRDVYLPLFPNQQPENAGNLRVLLWIRNDRHSNERSS